MWCWGHPIGAGDEAKDILVPKRVPALDDAVEIASGHTHTCARRKNGSVVCWGNNDGGQLGDDAREPAVTPREILGPE